MSVNRKGAGRGGCQSFLLRTASILLLTLRLKKPEHIHIESAVKQQNTGLKHENRHSALRKMFQSYYFAFPYSFSRGTFAMRMSLSETIPSIHG